MVGTGRNDPNFCLELVGGLSQRLVLDFGLVRDLLHGCSSSIGTAKTDHLAVDLAPTALSAWRSFRCPVGSADRRARRLRELGPGTQEQSGEALSLIESWAGAEAVIVVDAGPGDHLLKGCLQHEEQRMLQTRLEQKDR